MRNVTFLLNCSISNAEFRVRKVSCDTFLLGGTVYELCRWLVWQVPQNVCVLKLFTFALTRKLGQFWLASTRYPGVVNQEDAFASSLSSETIRS